MKITAKKTRSEKSKPGPFGDILEIANVLISSEVPEKVIEAVLMHLCERLGKRARCALLEGEDLRLRFWAGEHACPVDGIKISRESVVWDAVRKGNPINLTDASQAERYQHTLSAPINVKSIIPLRYTDPLSKQNKNLGVLIVDSGKEGIPISPDEFEYLQVIGHLISAIFGRTDLIQQLMASCRRQEAILMEAAHNFRNSIAIIGGFSRRILKLAEETEMSENARGLHDEVKSLETYFAQFEKYMQLIT